MTSFPKLDNYLFIIQFLLLTLISPTFILGGFIPGVSIILISLIYIYFFFKHKLYKIIKKNYVIIFSVFNLVLILSSIFSDHTILSLDYSLFYFRYGILALAIAYLFINNPKLLRYFLLSILLVVFVFIGDSILQFISGSNILDYPYDPHYRRLSGLFKDEQVLGLFLFKLSPLLLFYIHLIHKNNIYYDCLYLLTILLLFLVIILSGERTSLALFVLFISVYFAFSKKFVFQNLILIFFSGVLLISSFIIKPDLYKRVVFETIEQVNTKNDISSITIFSPGHTKHYLTALDIFSDNFVLGSGPKTFRVVCGKYPYDGCSTHPHNFLLQLLSETGIIGTVTGILIYLILISALIKYRPTNKNNESKEYFLIFLSSVIIIYFPFLPSNNFFHQWINIQNYILIGFILYTHRDIK